MPRRLVLLLCLTLVVGSAWLAGQGGSKPDAGWQEVAPGVLRSPGLPAGYALIQGERALLIDAPGAVEALASRGVRQIDQVLLTHHHRDMLGGLAAARKLGARVRAGKGSAAWLDEKPVAAYWKEALPLRNSRTAYLVVPEGVPGVDCTLEDGSEVAFGDWLVRAIATPGHSFDHMAYLAVRKGGGKKFLFAGDAVAGAGTLWSPYTTDWDHWTDAGLKPAIESLRKLAGLRPDVVLPAHGEVIGSDVKSGVARRALEQTASALDEVAFLKSYERFTRERLQNVPRYAFLAKEQAGSNGSKPWSRLSKNLWLTGNTYVLRSKDGPCLIVDPWDPNSAKQIPLLQKDEKLGRTEVVLCSHAHFDHYDGAYLLLQRDRPEVWTLDQVAGPIADPFRLRAPFLDARPLPVARRLRDGETARWREYSLKFHFFPGQTLYTMAVETQIDGKRCLFTGDNFFHHELYSGSGGWMGLNRSGPGLYEQSARKVLSVAPEWVLAEHGSAMEFSEADFKRRVQWGQAGVKAANAVSPTGRYEHDWNPHHVRIEPVLQRVRAGQTVNAELCIDNVLGRKRTLTVQLEGRGKLSNATWELTVPAGGTLRHPVRLTVPEKMAPGRQVFALNVKEGTASEPGDAFVVFDVE
ncbi:MAG: MBL fold metallo-hydrolase [Gemmataceae bacterium]